MSDYTPSGDPTDGTTADATELSAEFILIQTAVNSKADETNAVLVTPNIGTPSAGTLTNCTGLPISTGVSGLGSGIATFLATPSSANLATAVTGETGSGALVFATSPTLTTPDIGTPSAGVLTNCTGTAAGLTAGNATTAAAVAVGGITGLGSGVATWLTTPSSTNLAAAVTGETGSGALVFATSPTLTTPTLGVATATTLNGITIKTCPAGIGGTNTVAVGGSTTGTALQNGATGCSFFGDASGSGVTTGDRNTFVGYSSGAGTTTASDNVCVGAYSGNGLTVGNSNTLVGNNTGYASMTGSQNTLLGYGAGADTDGAEPYIGSGSNNIAIGWNSAPSASNVSNEITLGNSSIATLRCQVTSITALSDARDKTGITPLPSGLNTVMSLNPVRFTWNMRDGGKVGVKDSGFIAQELQVVDDEYLNLVYASNPDKLEATYGRLIPVLVKAIQELKAEVDNLRNQLL